MIQVVVFQDFELKELTSSTNDFLMELEKLHAELSVNYKIVDVKLFNQMETRDNKEQHQYKNLDKTYSYLYQITMIIDTQAPEEALKLAVQYEQNK